MSNVTVNFDLADIEAATRKLLQPTMQEVANDCMREAKKNAPVSPTVSQYNKTLVRKRRTRRRFVGGGLEKSISRSVEFSPKGQIEAHIFVPRNSAAGAYADYIHNKKNIKWFKRGIGTVAKGVRADEKFIERAVNDNWRKYALEISRVVERAIKETGGKNGI